MAEQNILITGSAGAIGSLLRRTLAQPGRRLRLLDTARQDDATPDERVEIITASFFDSEALQDACRDVDVVIHLGGLSTGGYSWPQYLESNINGTHAVLDAARTAGVQRVIYASSNHAVGFESVDNNHVVGDYAFPRPDSYYGVSKAASESLCSLYHDRYGLDVICLRIGSYRERPNNERALWSWLSPGDCTRLFEAALTTPKPGYRVVWGVSANSRARVSLVEAHEIGYEPLDDAEAYAHDVASSTADASLNGRLGGPYTATDFDDAPREQL